VEESLGTQYRCSLWARSAWLSNLLTLPDASTGKEGARWLRPEEGLVTGIT
jgi:hypothetical protein